jgi:hypothetical protein
MRNQDVIQVDSNRPEEEEFGDQYKREDVAPFCHACGSWRVRARVGVNCNLRVRRHCLFSDVNWNHGAVLTGLTGVSGRAASIGICHIQLGTASIPRKHHLSIKISAMDLWLFVGNRPLPIIRLPLTSLCAWPRPPCGQATAIWGTVSPTKTQAGRFRGDWSHGGQARSFDLSHAAL